MPHIFKPGDMAIVIACVADSRIVGTHCIVESHPRDQLMMRPDGTTYTIQLVDISVAHPTIVMANVTCLRYLPPEEWPELAFKQRELVRVEGTPHESNTKQPLPDKRELETTE